MTAQAWLIAEREFRTYTMTASFWIALALGPLVMAGAMVLADRSEGPARPIVVVVHTANPDLARSARAALVEAARLEGRPYAPVASTRSASNLELVRTKDGVLEARFSAGFPVSASGRALIARTIERDEAVRLLAAAGGERPPMSVREVIVDKPGSADVGALSRFLLVMILWLTLTGSLGMLLQAVVRERANRALEGLLAATRPWQIVLGKIVGVGGVSALILIAWLASACALAALSPAGGGLVHTVIGGLAAPAVFARAVAIYGLAFLFYGLVTVAVGAAAGDSAAAQNLARPMFAVLLAAFFVALAEVTGGADRLSWLVYAPPFTPFMLLLQAPGTLPATQQLVAVGLMLGATAIAGRLAVGRLTLSGAADRPQVTHGSA